MLEVIKKTYRVEDEEITEYTNLTLECNELEENEYEIEIGFSVNGEIIVEDGFGAYTEDLDVKINSITTAVDGNTIYIQDRFDVEGLEEEIKEYLVVTSYENLEFEGSIRPLLESYLENRNICEE